MRCCSCRRSSWGAFVAIAVGVVTACAVHMKKVEAAETANLSFPAAGLANLHVETGNGDISCHPSAADAAEVAVVVSKTASGEDKADAEACLKAIDVVAKVEGDALFLGWKWNVAKPPSHWEASVSFEVTAPAALFVDASTHNGAIRLDQADNGASLETHNGEITVGRCSGKIVAASHNGDVAVGGSPSEIELTLHNGDAIGQFADSAALSGSVQNHNGDIQLSFGPNVSTEATCGTHLGELVAGGDGIAVKRRGDSNLVATIGDNPDGANKLRVQTHNGDVAILRMPASGQ